MTRKRVPEPDGGFNDAEAKSKASWIFEEGFVRQTAHFKEELKNANATMLDVEYILKSAGSRIVKREYDKHHSNYKYSLKGVDPDGEELTIVFSLNIPASTLNLITAF